MNLSDILSENLESVRKRNGSSSSDGGYSKPKKVVMKTSEIKIIDNHEQRASLNLTSMDHTQVKLKEYVLNTFEEDGLSNSETRKA